MIRVKNLNGSSKDDPPKGYSSWIGWWKGKKEEKGEKVPQKIECSAVNEHKDKKEEATDGAHVIKADKGQTKERYIVPLCHRCNETSKIFKVKKSDMEPIRSK